MLRRVKLDTGQPGGGRRGGRELRAREPKAGGLEWALEAGPGLVDRANTASTTPYPGGQRPVPKPNRCQSHTLRPLPRLSLLTTALRPLAFLTKYTHTHLAQLRAARHRQANGSPYKASTIRSDGVFRGPVGKSTRIGLVSKSEWTREEGSLGLRSEDLAPIPCPC